MTYVLLGEQLNKCMLFLLLLKKPIDIIWGPSPTPILSQKTLRGENRGILREYIWKGSLFKPQVAMERESTLGSNHLYFVTFSRKDRKLKEDHSLSLSICNTVKIQPAFRDTLDGCDRVHRNVYLCLIHSMS